MVSFGEGDAAVGGRNTQEAAAPVVFAVDVRVGVGAGAEVARLRQRLVAEDLFQSQAICQIRSIKRRSVLCTVYKLAFANLPPGSCRCRRAPVTRVR